MGTQVPLLPLLLMVELGSPITPSFLHFSFILI